MHRAFSPDDIYTGENIKDIQKNIRVIACATLELAHGNKNDTR